MLSSYLSYPSSSIVAGLATVALSCITHGHSAVKTPAISLRLPLLALLLPLPLTTRATDTPPATAADAEMEELIEYESETDAPGQQGQPQDEADDAAHDTTQAAEDVQMEDEPREDRKSVV